MVSNKPPIITTEFESLLDWSKNIDQRVQELQRIAILSSKSSEEFPKISTDRNGKRLKPSQIEQLVVDRKAIRLQKRGNHPHRQPRKRPDDDELTGTRVRYFPGMGSVLGKELLEKYNDGTLTMKEYRDAIDRYNGQWEREEQQRRADGELFYNTGQRCKKYDPRIDITPPELYQCMSELNWIMRRHSVVNYEVDEPPQKSQVITTIRNIARSDMYDNYNINNMKLDSIVDSFSYYSENKYHHHPLHNHSRIVTNLRMKVRSITNDIYKQVNDDVQLDIICKYILESATPSLKALAMEIRGTIIIMQRRSLDHPIPIQNRFMANVQAKIKKIDESIERKQCYFIKTDTGRMELDKKAYIELPDYIEYELIPTLNTLASEVKGSIKQKTYLKQLLEEKAYKKPSSAIPKSTVVIIQNMPIGSRLNGKRCFIDAYDKQFDQYTVVDTDMSRGVKRYRLDRGQFRRRKNCAEELLRVSIPGEEGYKECSVMEHRLYGGHYKLIPPSENFNKLMKQKDSLVMDIASEDSQPKQMETSNPIDGLDRVMCNVYIKLERIVAGCKRSLIKLRDAKPMKGIGWSWNPSTESSNSFESEWDDFVKEIRRGGGLMSLVKEIGKSMIAEPEERYYSKLHAVKVATSYAKYSKERGNAIRDMVDNGWVPSKTALDKALVLNEEPGRLVDDEWNTIRGHQSRPAIMLEEERYCNIIDSTKQPSRARVIEERMNMREHDRLVDIWSKKPDSEMKDYLKRRNDRITAPYKRQSQWQQHDKEKERQKKRKYNILLEKDIMAKKAKLQKDESMKAQLKRENKMTLIKKKVPCNEWPCQPRNQQYNHIGSLLLALHPVDMKMPEKETNYKVYQFKSEPIITTTLYTPPKLINVCNELGLSGKRLYFSPIQFPITNVETAGDDETFDQLKEYIVKQSSTDGNSPVVFHSTQPCCKRFVCKYTLRKEWEKKFGDSPFLRCKFSFSVKWDKYGYYIHISKPNPTYGASVGCCIYDEDQQMICRKFVVGCEFHSHNM